MALTNSYPTRISAALLYPPERKVPCVGRRVGLSGPGIAVTFSVLVHASVALLAVHHHRTTVSPVATVQSVLAEYDFVAAESEDTAAAKASATLPNAAPASRAPAGRSLPAAVTTNAVATNAGIVSTASEADAQQEPAAPTAAQDSSGPHFAMTVAPTFLSGAPGVIGSPVTGSSAGPSGGSGSSPIAAASADIPAKLRFGNVPAYTAAALAASVEANVPLEIVVSEGGIVISARALERVGYGLDEAAREGILAYRFTPAVRAGKPVAVRMQWLMRFQLR